MDGSKWRIFGRDKEDIVGPLRVLHVVPSFYPATYYGGPIFSTKALCDGAAQDEEIELRVITTDTAGPKLSDRVQFWSNPVTMQPGYQVSYYKRLAMTSISPGLAGNLFRHIRWADVIHLTGVYSFPTIPTLALCRLLGKPVVWSPRGSLQATSQWQDAPNISIKQIFERVCHMVRPQSTVLHVTAEMERATSCSRLGNIEVALIPNSIAVPHELCERSWRPDGGLRLMFISRIHEKKGLDVLVDALAELPPEVTLDVYGAGDPAYEQFIRQRVVQHGLERRVRFHGHVEGEAKIKAFQNADLFCLPTRSENFGLVVGEALAHGVPVITTTAAPWQGVVRESCGLWIEQGVSPLISAIRQLCGSDLAQMGARGRNWMIREFSPEGTAKQMVSVYRRLAYSVALTG
ncbi:glycosyltransferase [Proteobacteria bacterium 005FR1]|nr:glycosyltransferase [Proteobacteria bacterium 005FR1]